MKIKNILLKSKLLYIIGFIIFSCNACNDLDLAPLSSGSTDNWFSSNEEFDMHLNHLYDLSYWTDAFFHSGFIDLRTDDMIRRDMVNDVSSGSVSSTTGWVDVLWNLRYRAIQNANRIIGQLESVEGISEENKLRYEAEAKFHRAANYSKLIFHWGDVPFYNNVLSVEEAFSLSRKDKYEILEEIYNDFDFAAAHLPLTYSELKRATKGAALALKARIALYMEDYSVAHDAAKAVMDLGVYELYPEYQDLFSSFVKPTDEIIFGVPRSSAFEDGSNIGGQSDWPTTRTPGGFNVVSPSWQLLASFLCTDGLPIDESPLFDPQEPFKNRDPRCSKIIVAFGSELDGITYEPHPDSLMVYNSNSGQYVLNLDTRGNHAFAGFNGLTYRKWVNGELVQKWIGRLADPYNIVIRYADVLLIYAEAKIELGDIDQSVLDAINSVRERAYKQSEMPYPEVTTLSQDELRKQLRFERRMEFGFEGVRRYNDLIRWRLAEKVINMPTYGLLADPDDIREKLVKPGLWFWGDTPPIDEDGIAHFEETEMYNEGRIRKLANRNWPDRQYLWPIPSSEIKINENLVQNPGY
jgi:hypothetical protein